MRHMGYVAAAAAGMIAPLAIALPAFASTQSPVLTGVSSVLQNDWDDDGNGDGYIDENGDGYDDNDLHDDLNDDDGYLRVEAAESTSTGDVSILVWGEDYPDFEDVVVSSPSLVDNCDSTDLDSVTAETDRYGQFNLAVSATECEVGTYQIIVTEQDEFTSKIVNVDID